MLNCLFSKKNHIYFHFNLKKRFALVNNFDVFQSKNKPEFEFAKNMFAYIYNSVRICIDTVGEIIFGALTNRFFMLYFSKGK